MILPKIPQIDHLVFSARAKNITQLVLILEKKIYAREKKSAGQTRQQFAGYSKVYYGPCLSIRGMR